MFNVLHASDWLHKSQGVWTQDFPLKPASAASAASAAAGAGAGSGSAGSSSKSESKSDSKPESKSESKTPASCQFEEDLVDYLRRYPPALDVVAEVRRHDFSAARVVLVPSVPGTHKGADLHKYGHMKVRRVLSKEPIDAKFAASPVIAQYSSTGSLTPKWMDELTVLTLLACHLRLLLLHAVASPSVCSGF